MSSTFLQWKNPEGPSSKCSYEREHAHCSVPVNECTPSGDKTQCLYMKWLKDCLRWWLTGLFCINNFKTKKKKPNFTLRASRLRLISAVSIKVVRSLLLTSVPRSFPAKSTSENFPCSVDARLLRRNEICRTACERDELLFAEVWPEVLGRWQKEKYCRGLYKPARKYPPHKNNRIKSIQLPVCCANLYHFDDLLCCGHIDLLQAHNLHLLSLILQDPQLGLLVQQVKHLI